MANTDQRLVIRALYDDDDTILSAVKSIREKGHYIEEAYTPFPIHGLDKAMGLEPTRISIAGFMYGLTGLSFAIWMTWFMMIHDWPMNIGGKPNDNWLQNMPAFVPIMFELTVFFTAHLMVWTYWAINGLYPGRKAMNPDPRTTDDKFMLEISADHDKDALISLLKETGAIELKEEQIED